MDVWTDELLLLMLSSTDCITTNDSSAEDGHLVGVLTAQNRVQFVMLPLLVPSKLLT